MDQSKIPQSLEAHDIPKWTPSIEKKIKWSATLIALGLLIQLASLTKIHPLAFVAFLMVGCPLVAAGILLYLVSLVTHVE